MDQPSAQALTLGGADTGRHYRASMVLIVLLMCFGSLAYAYAGGVIATTLGQPSFYTYMGLDTNPNANAIIGATTSLFYVGGFLGSFFAEWMGDRYGRKPAILTGLSLVLVSAALCAGSVNIAMFIVFRFTAGFGGLMMSMAVPLWITECVPPDVRGAFAQLHGAFVNLGYLLAGYVGVGFFFHVDSTSSGVWRAPQAIGCAFCIPLLAGIWWVPESPRLLILKGRNEVAWAVVRRFHTRPGDDDHGYAEREMQQMRKQIEFDRTLPSSWIDLFRKKSYRKRALMAIFVVFIIQATGSQVMAIYATTIFRNLGYSPAKQLLLQAGINALAMPLSTGAVFWTEKVKRTTLISAGLTGIAVVLCCYTGITANLSAEGGDSLKLAATAMTYLFFAFYAASVEGPFYYYVSEMFPTHLRAKGMALQATTFSWTSILWAQAAPTAIANIGWRFFIIFIVLTSAGAAIVYFCYPDTQGKTLEEVAAFFGDDELVHLYHAENAENSSNTASEQHSTNKVEASEKWEENTHPGSTGSDVETKA